MRQETPFDSAWMADGYAQARPRLHARILARALRAAGWAANAGLALDAGCGAGLSTEALLQFAPRCAGCVISLLMVRRAAQRLAGVPLFAARLEELPLPEACCALATAAGSLNYCDLPAALPELSRALMPGGLLVVYDFSPGRRFAEEPALEQWFAEFLRRFPAPGDGAVPLDPQRLRALCAGLFAPVAAEAFEERLPYDAAAYAAYLMTETNVAAALRAGEAPDAIRLWMDAALPAVFGGARREVCFDCYFAVFAKPSSASTRSAP